MLMGDDCILVDTPIWMMRTRHMLRLRLNILVISPSEVK